MKNQNDTSTIFLLTSSKEFILFDIVITRLSVLLLCLISVSSILCTPLFSQTGDTIRAKRIKSDISFVWGEGEAKLREKALRMAEGELLRSIQVSISEATASGESIKRGVDGTIFSSEFLQKQESFTSIHLLGLQKLIWKENNLYKALAYIDKESLEKSFEIRKGKIRGFFKTAEIAVENGSVGEALRNLYWGYLLSRSLPDTMHLGDRSIRLSNNPQVALTGLINALINDIDVKANKPYYDGLAVIIPLEFNIRGKQVRGLYFKYYSGIGMEYASVEDGLSDVPIYDKITSQSRKLTISFEYAYANEMTSDPEIAGLYNIFKDIEFRKIKNVSVTFPWLKNDETSDEKGPSKELVLPEPKTEALSVLQLRREIVDFLDVLEQYSKLGILRYGRKNEFEDVVGCYVAVANDKEVIEILYYDGLKFISTKSGMTYSDLSKNFKGKRQIWIKENP